MHQPVRDWADLLFTALFLGAVISLLGALASVAGVSAPAAMLALLQG
jgi:hypothetical protein